MAGSHHVRTLGQYVGALSAPMLPEQLAWALGVPVRVVEHDAPKLVELGFLSDTDDGRYERGDRAGEL